LSSSSSFKNISKKRRKGKSLPSPPALLLSSVAPLALLLSSSCDGDGKKSTGRSEHKWEGGREVDGLGAGREVGWRSRYEFTETKLGSRMVGPKKKWGEEKKGPGKK
jgi:hypothetical protein